MSFLCKGSELLLMAPPHPVIQQSLNTLHTYGVIYLQKMQMFTFLSWTHLEARRRGLREGE